MFNRNHHKNKKHKGFNFFVLLLWLIFSTASAFSQTPQYELNDPRNPDCPCHKAQKQAEQEYAQLNLPKDNAQQYPPIDQLEASSRAPEKKDETAKRATPVTSVSGKNKRKNKTSRIRKSMFRYLRKQGGIKKMHTDYSVCFHNW